MFWKITDFILCALALILVIIMFICFAHAITLEDKPENYVVYGTVINSEKDNITIVDDNGNYWDYYTDEPTQDGDLVRLIIMDNATKEIEDDEILKVYNLTNLTRS